MEVISTWPQLVETFLCITEAIILPVGASGNWDHVELTLAIDLVQFFGFSFFLFFFGSWNSRFLIPLIDLEA